MPKLTSQGPTTAPPIRLPAGDLKDAYPDTPEGNAAFFEFLARLRGIREAASDKRSTARAAGAEKKAAAKKDGIQTDFSEYE